MNRPNLVERAKLWTQVFMRASYPRDLPLLIQAFAHRHRLSIPGDIWQTIEPLGGFLSVKEAGLLYWAACARGAEGPVIELGSFEGKSTILFARCGCQVHSVDAWSLDVSDRSAYQSGIDSADGSFARFNRNLQAAHVEDLVTIHRGRTHEIGRDWNICAALLYVDAGHTYADVKGDLDLWSAHLKANGLLLMHDVLGDQFLDVTRAASELLRHDWRVVASAGSIVAFARRSTEQ